MLRIWKTCFKRKYFLWWTLLGVAVGISLGAGLYNLNCSKLVIELIGYPGELMIRALEEIVLPLIMLALMTGVFSLRSTNSGTGRITRWSMLYYLLSMLLAVGLGISLVYSIRPGRGAPLDDGGISSCSSGNSTVPTSAADHSTVGSLLNIGRNAIPTNIVSAAASSNFLGIITFSVIFAFTLMTLGDKAEVVVKLIEVCNAAVMKIVLVLILFTPVGVASLIAKTILNACSIHLLLKSLGLYIVTVLSGLVIHSFIILPLTVFILSRRNPVRVFRSFLPALVMGFSTSSGAATMPVTMQCGEDYGCEKSIVQFVVPLGTNINRDGTALYEAVAVIFICQAHGVSLSIGSVIVIAISATLAAIGTASIPNAALVSFVTVLQAVSLPQYISDISILFAVDWILGMVRTSVNIWGDACACVIVDKWEKSRSKTTSSLPKYAEDKSSPSHEDGVHAGSELTVRSTNY
ncbi:hypothetical protein GOP47_0016140 [Adiantum capillus-veneris]|uniref:Amino acid transporter n=1 Tax=Adiantum capillus-veneris TaxID=13818 RepID=A0A9D4UL00_ADICA|nr:hypothetical protein GOP47_0015810 [Adiantum capillus-veneris]KAI5069839.1 hypothetical protein GOP47_0016140 [Adiantum capillus-veneris]